jgi:hypothetical protein
MTLMSADVAVVVERANNEEMTTSEVMVQQ